MIDAPDGQNPPRVNIPYAATLESYRIKRILPDRGLAWILLNRRERIDHQSRAGTLLERKWGLAKN